MVASFSSNSTVVRDADILTAGTGVTPAAGTILARVHVCSATQNTVPLSQMMQNLYVVAPGGNSVTVNVQLSFADPLFEATAYANGVLL